MKNTYHKPVLVKEVLEYIDPQPNGLYIDVTFGGGGHTRAILEAEPTCKVVACDWDKIALETNAEKLADEFGDRVQFIWGNFAHLYKLLKKEKITNIDGILADFGTSQDQIFNREGFSFAIDSPLDMRMSPAHQRLTAADIVNRFSEQKLAQMFFDLGEERFSRQIARAIVQDRVQARFKTTKQLATLIERVVPAHKGRRKVHPATRVFQALRIHVNHELENIQAFLMGSLRLLKPGGRLVCISFHSLEDRLVKRFFQEHSSMPGREGFELLMKKVVVAGDEEVEENPSSRYARLRAAKKS